MKRFRFRNAVCLILAIVLLGSLFTACGQSDAAKQSDNSVKQETKGSAEVQSSTEQPKEKSPADYKATLKLWSWNESIKKIITEFNKTYPNIQIDLTPVQAADYLKKFQTSVAAGMELPDLAMAEMTWRGRIYELDIWEDLQKAPYNFDKSQLFDYVIPLISNSKGQIVGIERSVSPAALAYRRDLAKQYFGTDNPDELEAMLPDWDTFLKKGLDVKEKSGGKVFMFTGIDDVNIIMSRQNPKPIVNGDTITADGTVSVSYDWCVKMRDAGIIDKIDTSTPAWSASYSSGKYIFYPAANWSLDYVIKPNDKDGSGRWGLMMPPGGAYSYGGTSIGIIKQSKEKEAAWQFIKWGWLTKEGSKANKEILSQQTPLKEVYNDPNFFSDKSEFFGGQDVGKFWIDKVVPNLKVKPISPYDQTISQVDSLICKALNNDSSLTAASAVAKFKEEIKNKIPELKVN